MGDKNKTINENVPDKTIAIFTNTMSGSLDLEKNRLFKIIKKPDKKRDWFSPHFYRCLPLTIGNQYGFIITNEFDFSFVWNGKDSLDALTFEFNEGIEELDKVQSYTTLATCQKIMGKPNSYITDIQLKLIDINLAPAAAKKYKQLYATEAIDIQTANSQFETGSFVRTLISYAVGVTLLIVAGFGIYNILNMMIYEKMDSIAILKATGFSGKDVNTIFIFIALTIGIVGGLLGLIFGFGLSALIEQIPFKTASLPKVKTYPISYNPMFYIIGAIFSLITTYFAGYFPSKKASKIDPVDIIRGK
jgi:ABC-type lipoprotein release transport system permease subunit